MSGGDSSPENRRKEIARAIIMEDDRYEALRNMLITSLPSFGPQELATTISALADIHAFAAHGRRPVIRLPEFDPGGFDSQLAVAIAESIKKNGASLSPKQTVMLVSGLRGLGRVADRVVDDDGWAAVARSVERNAVRNGEDKTYSTSTAKNHVKPQSLALRIRLRASHYGFVVVVRVGVAVGAAATGEPGAVGEGAKVIDKRNLGRVGATNRGRRGEWATVIRPTGSLRNARVHP